jgi:hypothetical protein
MFLQLLHGQLKATPVDVQVPTCRGQVGVPEQLAHVAEHDRKGRTLIPRGQIERLAGTIRLRDVVARVVKVRNSSASTARKYVMRCRKRRMSLEEILDTVRL